MEAGSASIRIDLAGFAREGSLVDHTDVLALAREADALGFGGIWFNEFHFDRTRLSYPSTLLLGSAILAVTERLRFGTSILPLALYNPLLLAEQVAQLDRQSAGRVDVGIGRATDPASFQALGIAPQEADGRFADALDILRMAWAQDRISHQGVYWSFQDIGVGPPPIQTPHPPIYMAAVSPNSIDRAARLRLPLLYSLEPNEDRQVTPFRQALARHGHGLEPLHASSASRYVLVDRNRDTALAQLDALTDALNAKSAARAIANGKPPPPLRSRAQMLAGYAIAGTPDDCIAQIKETCGRLQTHSIRAFFSANGAIPVPQARRAMRLFAAQVLPALIQPQYVKEFCS